MDFALAIQGGGIRGIIPCQRLVALEQLTGKLTRELFSYVAGTSTGALLAAAIAAGIPASELLKVYTERSKDIFTPTGILAQARRATLGYMYEPTRLRDVLVDVFGGKADWTLNRSPIGICISAVAMNGHNWYFVRNGAANAGTTGQVKLIDAAVASACAPTYHDHWKIDMPDGVTRRFFDGGTGGVANPAYECCVEMFDHDQFHPLTTRLIVLGTGFYPQSDEPPKGLLATIGWATSTLVDSSSDWVDAAVERQWPRVAIKYETQLPRAIDEADLSAIPELVAIGAREAARMDWQKILGLKLWDCIEMLELEPSAFRNARDQVLADSVRMDNESSMSTSFELASPFWRSVDCWSGCSRRVGGYGKVAPGIRDRRMPAGICAGGAIAVFP